MKRVMPMANKTHRYSVVPPSGYYVPENGFPQGSWPSYPNITQGFRGALSVAGWTSGNLDGTVTKNGNEGYPQQTFLGASIRSFNVSAGFGDSSSTMGVELVNDEYNRSDGRPFGLGDDVYHNGIHDKFRPPVVGAPVFFKFGKNHADVEQAFRKDFDQIYSTPKKKIDTLNIPPDPFPIVFSPLPVTQRPDGYYLMEKNNAAGVAKWIDKSVLLDHETKWRGFAHFTFGGILQSYTENRSTGGNPLYSVKLSDPREILANTQVILNNYQGTTFDNKNLYNVYGFLEYDISDDLLEEFETKMKSKDVLTKSIDEKGNVEFKGKDVYVFDPGDNDSHISIFSKNRDGVLQTARVSGEFPITGQGFSRRSDNGIPWYRVEQALTKMFNYKDEMPHEYKSAGFGGTIDFRGYNYVVDWGGIPTEEIPKTYYLDFDKLSMMELAQELCDVLSRDLYVSLLPVIDHPSCEFLYKENEKVLQKARQFPEDSPQRQLILGSGLTAGIIRIDSIDKKKQPQYGAIKQYLTDLELNDIYVENRDVGFEVSNVTTDKFIVGAQEVDMYYFNTLRDRDTYFQRLEDHGDAVGKAGLEQLNHDKWTIETNQNQQVLPFYGFLGDKAVTIPRGFGSYQQILLDTRGLDAHGVGAYYVATEMELRAAAVGYKNWSEFLYTYNEIYIQELTDSMGFYASLSDGLTDVVAGLNDQLDDTSPIKDQLSKLTEGNRKFGVSVPRSVWNSGKNDEVSIVNETYGDGEPVMEDPDGDGVETQKTTEVGGAFEGKMEKGYPASPCNPPYGYPLYYKRAEKIGLPKAGYLKVIGQAHSVMTNMNNLQDMQRKDKQRFSYVKSMAGDSIRRIRALIKEKIKNKEFVPDAKPEALKIIEEDIAILEARIKKIQENVAQEAKDLKKLRESRKIQIANLKTHVKNSIGIIKELNRKALEGEKNAKKVFNFIKKVADENLGKKFLVKIPRACNVNWNENLFFGNGNNWDVKYGPYGFKPQPISTKPDFEDKSEYWQEQKDEFEEMSAFAERSGPVANILEGSIWPTRSQAHWHYLDVDSMGQEAGKRFAKHLTHFGSGYTFGALKSNYNPMSEKWEHNYTPQPQGGFFNYALFDKNIRAEEAEVAGVKEKELPPATRQLFAPKLMDKLISDGNRVQCYVRYDHSQNLDLSSINASDLEQQTIGKDGIIPDFLDTLPNLHPEKKGTLDEIQDKLEQDKEDDKQVDSVAFVKCEIDERLYMPPKTIGGQATVWAEDFVVALAPQPYEVVWVDGEGEYEGCKVPKEVKKRPTPIFAVENGGLLTEDGESEIEQTDSEGEAIPDPDNEGETKKEKVTPKDAHKVRWDDFDRKYSETYKEWIIKTEEKDLDSKHVYALITVPGRIIPTVASRYVETSMVNPHKISNAMTQDVVKIEEFKKPLSLDHQDTPIDCNNLPDGVEFSFADISRAIEAQKSAVKGIGLSSNGDGSTLAFIAPSPVYPDLVALPLMSNERCYGPWVSSAADFRDEKGKVVASFGEIGGKIEFEKDEGLAPWSYAGYRLMDEAAKLKTKFSNSLLLLTERGSFSYPSAPIDVSLAKALRDKGPLVTSISVNVTESSIKTSVKLDLYTSQFGKLQKQKEIAIAQISRERQKILDQNNNLKRRGMAKGAADMDLLGTFKKAAGSAISAAEQSKEIFTALERGDVEKASEITISAAPEEVTFDGSPEFKVRSENFNGVSQTQSQIQEMGSLFEDELEFKDAMDKTAGGSIPDIFKGVSDDPFNKYFASRRINNQVKKNRRTFG